MESIVFPGFDFPMTARAALLVIDMQPCGVGAEAGLVKAIESTAPGYTKYLVDRVERVVIPNIRRLAETVRGHGRPVYFTAFASAAGDGSDVATSTIRYRDAQRRAGRPKRRILEEQPELRGRPPCVGGDLDERQGIHTRQRTMEDTAKRPRDTLTFSRAQLRCEDREVWPCKR